MVEISLKEMDNSRTTVAYAINGTTKSSSSNSPAFECTLTDVKGYDPKQYVECDPIYADETLYFTSGKADCVFSGYEDGGTHSLDITYKSHNCWILEFDDEDAETYEAH